MGKMQENVFLSTGYVFLGLQGTLFETISFRWGARQTNAFNVIFGYRVARIH